ncbi:MAG: hypothetical protein ACLVJ6_12385 [Merdibacter sp.]
MIERAQSHQKGIGRSTNSWLSRDVLVKGQPLEMLWRPSKDRPDCAGHAYDSTMPALTRGSKFAQSKPSTPMVAYTLGYLLEKTGQSPWKRWSLLQHFNPEHISLSPL